MNTNTDQVISTIDSMAREIIQLMHNHSRNHESLKEVTEAFGKSIEDIREVVKGNPVIFEKKKSKTKQVEKE